MKKSLKPWQRKVAEHHPLAVLIAGGCFLVLLISYFFGQDGTCGDPLVGVATCVMGAYTILGILLTPTDSLK